jgi:hypothetical protein
MILDRQHAFASASTPASDREPRRPPNEQGTPLAEFPWSDDVVGMGFFPHELALPAGWRWEAPR